MSLPQAAVAPPPCQPPPTTFSASQFYNGLVQLAAADGTTPGESVGSITNSIDQPSNVAAAGGKRKRSRRGSTVKGHLNVTREENGALLAPQGVGSEVMPGSWSGGQTVLSSGPLSGGQTVLSSGPLSGGQTVLSSGPLSGGQTDATKWSIVCWSNSAIQWSIVWWSNGAIQQPIVCWSDCVIWSNGAIQWSIIWRSNGAIQQPIVSVRWAGNGPN